MNRAKQIRLDEGWGVVEVITQAKISPKTLTKIEAGEEVAAASLARLAEFYKVKPTELLRPAIFEEAA